METGARRLGRWIASRLRSAMSWERKLAGVLLRFKDGRGFDGVMQAGRVFDGQGEFWFAAGRVGLMLFALKCFILTSIPVLFWVICVILRHEL